MLKALLKAVKRRQGESTPKQPVTPDMLREARKTVVDGSLRGLTMWAGLLTGFGFLLRASEYLAYDGEGLFEEEFVIRWSEVTFRKEGKPVVPEDGVGPPDEVVVKFRGSKSDQFRAGCVRNLFSTGITGMCPVSALWDLATALGPLRRLEPVMCVPGEDPIGRSEVAGVLRDAALALGQSPDNLTTHSLRAGGATALYAAGHGEAEITYHGRWASASWLLYVHRTVARSGELAASMFMQKVSLLRLAAQPGGRVGRITSSTTRGKAGDKASSRSVPPQGSKAVPAPTIRTPSSLSTTPRVSAPAAPTHRRSSPVPKVSPSTPAIKVAKALSGPRTPHRCALQSLFDYGSPG